MKTTAPKGSDPILDEDGILTLLNAVISPATTNALQAGAVQTLLDLYDRGVTRKEFCEQGSECLAMYGTVAKLWMLNNMHQVFSEHGLTEEKFKAAEAQLVELIQKQTLTLIATVQRLQQCPTSEDKIH